MTPARYLTWVPALGLALGLACASAHAEINLAAYRDLDDCDAAMNLYASDIDICHCYVNLAERERSWKQVVAHLQDRLVSEPDDPRLTYALGLTDASRGDQRAEQTLLQSADLFAKLGDPAGEVQSLLSLFFLMRSVSPEAADQALTRAEGVAETSGNTELRTFVLY
ncbi:MAG TPA: hypothetical protein VFG76_02495, partial [Candidatus Polarisedimenticolia bacterium]|nr:hypothetical protein [Candidatus Polarisedimenticolia bacterium]